jgi:acetoacetyl-CoA synthetase
MGTAEFYAVVERFPEVADSLVVHVEDPGGGPGELWLFVVADGEPGDLPDRLRAALRQDLSPRHVPDRVLAVPAIPRTQSGKKLEVPVKRILSGVPSTRALTVASVANPESLEPFISLARERAGAETAD